MLFIGVVLIDGVLKARPILFIVWWAACTWLMMASLLLAIFDLLIIRAAARRERRELAKRIFQERPPNENTH